MPQEIKPLLIKGSIDPATTPADLQPWDAQESIITNTGIERDGGVTNLYTAIESNSQYNETFYTSNGHRARLQFDAINDLYRVYSDDNYIGKAPKWCVKSRQQIPISCNDVMLTVDGTFLALRIESLRATIEEYDATFKLLRQRSWSIPAAYTGGYLVRYVAPSWATVTSIVGVRAGATFGTLSGDIITDTGAVYASYGNGISYSTQMFAFYKNGWILSVGNILNSWISIFNSAGVRTNLEAGQYLSASIDSITGDVSLNSFYTGAGAVSVGRGTTYTPPATMGGAWTITQKTKPTTWTNGINTFGGQLLLNDVGATTYHEYDDNRALRQWTTYNTMLPEIYGLLDNKCALPFKIHTVQGTGSYFSASFDPDGIGLPITEIGEIDGGYFPQIIKTTAGDYCLLYRRGDGSYAFVTVSDDISITRMQEVAPGIVKINTISAACLINTSNNKIQFSGNAFNGFIIPFVDTVGASNKAVCARHRGEFGGSVDAGIKLSGADAGNLTGVVLPESNRYTYCDDTIDVYYGPPPSSLVYALSLLTSYSWSKKSDLTGTIYVDDQTIPPPAGATYQDKTIALLSSTAIRHKDYDGYQLLNETPGLFSSFTLFGTLYLFDGIDIYATTLNAEALTAVTKVASACGLKFVTVSPQAAYFASAFDNSLYTFDGGQAGNKYQRLSQKGSILFGAYSTKENTLAVFTHDTVLFFRDGVISETPLPITSPFTAYSTTEGIWIEKGGFAIKYLYSPVFGTPAPVIDLFLDGGIWGTVYADIYDGGIWGTPYDITIQGVTENAETGIIAPLVWQSKYNGYSDRTKQNLDRYLFRVYKEDKAETTIAVEYHAYREDAKIAESVDIIIGSTANPYDADGYALVEYIPQDKNATASSIKLTCADKILLLDGYATIKTAGDTVAKNRG